MATRLRTAEQISQLSDDALLDYLGALADEIEAVKERQETLWAARIDVYQDARRRDPAITHGRLADAARVSEVAIITKLRQLEERAEAGTG